MNKIKTSKATIILFYYCYCLTIAPRSNLLVASLLSDAGAWWEEEKLFSLDTKSLTYAYDKFANDGNISTAACVGVRMMHTEKASEVDAVVLVVRKV